MVQLRPYQDRGVNDIREAFDTAQSVLYVAPTGAGKTTMFCYITHSAAAQGTRTCILVHRDTLLQQASRALTAAGVPHGLIAPGHTPTEDMVHVASVQTLVRRLDRHQFDFLVIDEGHHATAGSWRKILTAMPEAHLLGVTATPCRLDGAGLQDVYETMVMGPSTKELIDTGYLVGPVVYAPAHQVDLSRIRTRGGDWDQRELAATMDRPTVTGDAVAHYRRLCPNAPAVAFCVSVQHAEDVAADFNRTGIRAAAISGNMKAERVQDAVDALRDGRLQVIASCDLISEGFDAPCVAAAILLRPTQSEGLYIQQVGRALRPAPGKNHAIILDHSSNVFRHGMPDDDREWTLTGARRRGPMTAATVPVRQCPSCFACHRPGPRCPACGHIYQVEGREVDQVAGELVKVDPVLAKRLRQRKIHAAKTLQDLQHVADELGYKPGWVRVMWERRQALKWRTA
jgi:superfamily II DNA or RNA helicase